MAKNRILIDLCVVMHRDRYAQVHTHTALNCFLHNISAAKRSREHLENRFRCASSVHISASRRISGVLLQK